MANWLSDPRAAELLTKLRADLPARAECRNVGGWPAEGRHDGVPASQLRRLHRRMQDEAHASGDEALFKDLCRNTPWRVVEGLIDEARAGRIAA